MFIRRSLRGGGEPTNVTLLMHGLKQPTRWWAAFSQWGIRGKQAKISRRLGKVAALKLALIAGLHALAVLIFLQAIGGAEQVVPLRAMTLAVTVLAYFR